MKEILVFIETNNETIEKVSFELISEAKRLSEKLNSKVSAILLGENIEHLEKSFENHPIDKLIKVKDKRLKDYKTLEYTQVLSQCIEENKPEIVLFGATSIGRELAPRVSARVQTGLTADCTSLQIDDDLNLLMTRPAFGGNILATIICKNHRPQMATVREGVMDIIEVTNNKFETINYKVDLNDVIEIEILKQVIENKKEVDLSKAKIIIAGGRGIGSKENFDLLRELANEIDGEIAASRAAVDNKWIESSYQVGQTGSTVKADIYVAVGISGAIQHVAGMEKSSYIIAINNDENAPIFNHCDLGIVGDFKEILPMIINEINNLKK